MSGVKPEPTGRGGGGQSHGTDATQPTGASPTKPDGEKIEFSIKDPQGGEVKFKTKSKTPFQKVFTAWAAKKQVNAANYRFLTSEGQLIHAATTPAEAGVEDGDVIDAMAEQIGGSFPVIMEL